MTKVARTEGSQQSMVINLVDLASEHAANNVFLQMTGKFEALLVKKAGAQEYDFYEQTPEVQELFIKSMSGEWGN